MNIKKFNKKDEAEDYDNVQHPLEKNYQITLPAGFKQVYGEQLDDNMKAKACHYGFHPADDDGDICSYCFCYVNKEISTAFIEPVCTREKYRKQGLSRQMLYGVIIRLKELEIKNAYINSYDWRRKVYNSAGFETEDSIGFWHKKI